MRGNKMEQEAIKDGEAQEPIIEQQEQEKEAAPTLSEAQVREMLEEERKKWQSRFDTILAEKKQEEAKAMTVEERIKQLEEERQKERLEWARKEAKATARIDEDLELGILSYASNDSQKIQDGAKAIRNYIDAQIATYKTKCEELEKQVKYVGAAPTGGGQGASLDFASMAIDEVTAFVKQSPDNDKVYREWLKKKK